VADHMIVQLPTQDLLPGWEETRDPSSGRTYYYHEETRKTQWEVPTEKSLEFDKVKANAQLVAAAKSNDHEQVKLLLDAIEDNEVKEAGEQAKKDWEERRKAKIEADQHRSRYASDEEFWRNTPDLPPDED